jgi:hypothetical protein
MNLMEVTSIRIMLYNYLSLNYGYLFLEINRLVILMSVNDSTITSFGIVIERNIHFMYTIK